jgi:hypothetical protein
MTVQTDRIPLWVAPKAVAAERDPEAGRSTISLTIPLLNQKTMLSCLDCPKQPRVQRRGKAENEAKNYIENALKSSSHATTCDAS